jgi:phosphotransferase system  glucose/maltose/N-acetylglucosamine-specific IIC component
MIALFIGVLLVLFAVYAVLPFPWALRWWPDVIQFLKGGVPLIAVFIGLISFFVGVADIKDKIESRKEEEQEEEEEESKEEKGKEEKGP